LSLRSGSCSYSSLGNRLIEVEKHAGGYSPRRNILRSCSGGKLGQARGIARGDFTRVQPAFGDFLSSSLEQFDQSIALGISWPPCHAQPKCVVYSARVIEPSLAQDPRSERASCFDEDWLVQSRKCRQWRIGTHTASTGEIGARSIKR